MHLISSQILMYLFSFFIVHYHFRFVILQHPIPFASDISSDFCFLSVFFTSLLNIYTRTVPIPFYSPIDIAFSIPQSPDHSPRPPLAPTSRILSLSPRGLKPSPSLGPRRAPQAPRLLSMVPAPSKCVRPIAVKLIASISSRLA